MQLFRHLPSLPVLDATGAIDIVVVAFLVYQCLMVVRGTRAGAILLGIAVIVCLYLAAVWADLEALHSVLSLIVPYIGLAVIVLFQSEIRRTLASLGRRRLLGLAGVFHAPEAANEILMAVEQLAAKKTGALIVLERDIGLRTFIESGVRLEAQVSRDLLLSIFQPGLPLHDGAAIIQGTRHRAAIGITEETDCLSLVVSEETGRISVAAFGELTQGLTVPEVLERIHRHFGVERPSPAQIDESAADLTLAFKNDSPPPAGPSQEGAGRL